MLRFIRNGLPTAENGIYHQNIIFWKNFIAKYFRQTNLFARNDTVIYRWVYRVICCVCLVDFIPHNLFVIIRVVGDTTTTQLFHRTQVSAGIVQRQDDDMMTIRDVVPICEDILRSCSTTGHARW